MTTAYVYMEDLKVGDTFRAGSIEMTEGDIIAFARLYDPQDFHTDPVRAKDTVFGELVASGWHTAGVTMRLITMAMPKMEGGMVGRSVEKMSWPRPVRPGDVLSLQGEILDIRTSSKNPQRGVMRVRNTTFNQKGEAVLEMETIIFVPRRQA